MREISYKLKGLCCANCSAKIEDSAGKAKGVISARLSFATQVLTLTLDASTKPEELCETIKEIVKSIEHDVVVVPTGPQHNEDNEGTISGFKKDISVIATGLLLFLPPFIFNLTFWPELLMFAASYIITGRKVIYSAAKNIAKGRIFDENFLMTIATLGAFAIMEFLEAAAVMLFFKTGELFESMAVNKSRKSIKALVDIRPEYANLETPEGMVRIDPEAVNPGDVIIIKPGERVPLDGIVIEGSSSLDTSALTGESVPRDITNGDTILSGSINQSRLLTVEVTQSFSQSTVSRILDLVENAASKKAPAESFANKFASYYTPVVVSAALLIAVLPPILTGTMAFSQWLERALIFLVVSCPCALVVSIPLSFFGGIGAASRKGILIKGSSYLDALNSINTVVFDKTGTLTKGVFKVTGIHASNGFSEEDVLAFAALAECHSSHPIAKSIQQAYAKPIDKEQIQSYHEIHGQGIQAVISGKNILAGNARLMHIGKPINIGMHDVQGTVVHVAVDGVYAVYILISDEVREDSAKTVAALKDLFGIRVAMLTGDSIKTAQKIAGSLGISTLHAELLPHQKVETLQEFRALSGSSRVAFVGDGINDAPVLALSDIGIAMGGLGSDAAIEASDIVLMTDQPYKLVEAMKIARKTRSIVWQNIIFALGVKVLVMALGAGGIATMWEAVFADVGVTIIAVFNSLRVLRV